MKNIVLMGAAGKIGFRLAVNLQNSTYNVKYLEVSEKGREKLKSELGIECSPQDEALSSADVVILAVPDWAIGDISHSIEPQIKPGTMLVLLDGAAPFAGHLPERSDLVYFITHPCHPPMFDDETEPEAQRDFFGGSAAKQNIVCSLMQGPEDSFALGEEIAKTFFAPVLRTHRVTIEQMAILEPALSETMLATCLTILKEALDETVKLGVPKEAARDFLLGHMYIESAIIFEEIQGVSMSDAAMKAVELAKKEIFQDDWKKIFKPEAIKKSIRMITQKNNPG